MQTTSGRAFWPLDPRPEDICIRDIAIALSKLCRFGGHTHEFIFYSVAEHCLYGAHNGAFDLELQHLFLLHDASEAYLQDLILPLKRVLTDYRKIEARVEQVIFEKFGLWEAFQRRRAELKAIDDRMLATELRDLMADPPYPWAIVENVKPYPLKIEPRNDTLAVVESYLRLHQDLSERRGLHAK